MRSRARHAAHFANREVRRAVRPELRFPRGRARRIRWPLATAARERKPIVGRNSAGSRAFAAAVVSALLAVSPALAGCGGSSRTAGSGAASSASKHAITTSECQSLETMLNDFEDFYASAGATGLDYPKAQSTVDRLADTVAFPASVSDAYETWQEAIDTVASAFRDAGIKPNDAPLPDQLDKLNSEFHGTDALTKAGATINTWVQNGCD
jgi:hypothetical protein